MLEVGLSDYLAPKLSVGKASVLYIVLFIKFGAVEPRSYSDMASFRSQIASTIEMSMVNTVVEVC